MWTCIKELLKIMYHGLRVAGKTLQKSLLEEIEVSRELARIRRQEMVVKNEYDKKYGLSLNEAMKILDVNNLDSKLVQDRYDHLYRVNTKSQGGSFYLQSKVVRAKQRIELEMKSGEEAKLI